MVACDTMGLRAPQKKTILEAQPAGPLLFWERIGNWSFHSTTMAPHGQAAECDKEMAFLGLFLTDFEALVSLVPSRFFGNTWISDFSRPAQAKTKKKTSLTFALFDSRFCAYLHELGHLLVLSMTR